MKRVILAFLLALGIPAFAENISITPIPGQIPPVWVTTVNGVAPGIWFDFVRNLAWSPTATTLASTLLSSTRNSSATDLLPSSPAGYAYHTVGANTPNISPNVGLLVYGAATNQLLNSTAPATQTTGSLGTGTYTLWVNAPNTSTSINSATMSAGTATGCGTGVATQNSPVTFTITVAGTCTVTVAGTLAAFQLEGGSFGTPLIVTAGATAQRLGDTVFMTYSVPTSYTLFGVGIPQSVPGTEQVLALIDDGTLSNRTTMIRATDGSGKFTGVGGTGFTVFSNAVMAINVASGMAISATAGTQKVSDKNSSVASGSAATLPPGLTTLRLGGFQNLGSPYNGIITLVAVYNAAIGTSVSTLTTPY